MRLVRVAFFFFLTRCTFWTVKTPVPTLCAKFSPFWKYPALFR